MSTVDKKTVFLTVYIVCLICVSSHVLWAAQVSDPTWYDISFIELTPPGNNLYDNSLDMNINKNDRLNINFAQIVTALQATVPAGFENLKIRLNTPGGVFRFVKKDNPLYWMNASIRLAHENLPVQSVLPQVDYTIVAGSLGLPSTTTNFFIDIENISNPRNAHRGDYYLPLIIQILDNDGYIIAERTLQLFVHFRNQDTPVTPITTLTLDRYPSAGNISVPYPYMTGSSIIKVGSINFQSNEDFNKYRLRISPVDQPVFQFVHNNPNTGGAIQYRVTIPGRTIINYEQSFEFNLEYKGSIGSWNDFLEIGIRDVNYNNVRSTAGEYVSNIQIEVIAF